MKKVFLLIFLLILVPSVLGATLQGTIYDLDLDIVEGALVEIDTIPNQKILSNDGTYELTLDEGNYLLSATYEDQYIEEEVTINQEGEFQIDLFLYPDTRDSEEIFNEDFEVDQLYEDSYSAWWFLLLLIPIVLILYLFKRKKPEEDELEKKVFAIIKKEKRITQKELRKLFPFSEAKISLILTDLESKNKIKKIKKGRSNVIILV